MITVSPKVAISKTVEVDTTKTSAATTTETENTRIIPDLTTSKVIADEDETTESITVKSASSVATSFSVTTVMETSSPTIATVTSLIPSLPTKTTQRSTDQQTITRATIRTTPIDQQTTSLAMEATAQEIVTATFNSLQTT